MHAHTWSMPVYTCMCSQTHLHTHTNTCIHIHIHICVIIKNLSVENHGSPVMGIFSLLNFYLYRQENFVGLLIFRFQKPKGIWRHGSVAKSTCCSYSRFDIGSGHSCQVAFIVCKSSIWWPDLVSGIYWHLDIHDRHSYTHRYTYLLKLCIKN